MMPSVTQPRLQRAGVAARDQTRGATFGKVGGAVDGAETGEQGALPDAAFSIGAENLAVIGARGPHFKARGAEYGVLLRGEASGDDAAKVLTLCVDYVNGQRGAGIGDVRRSEERRVRKEGVGTGRYRWGRCS